MLFQQPNDLGSVPAGVTKFNGEPETFRKLDQKFPQDLPAIFRCEGRRELNENDLKLGFERLDRAEKSVQFIRAIAQPANVRDFAGKFAAKTKRRRSLFDPATNGVFGRRSVKGGIDFHRRQKASIKFEPFGIGQPGRIKASAPFRKAPCASADANFLLVGEVQVRPKSKLNRDPREDFDLEVEAVHRTASGDWGRSPLPSSRST